MRIYLLLFVIFSLAQHTLAATSLRFLPLNRNALALILPKDIYGNTDDDFNKLYSLLNVPEQDGPYGKGKGLKTNDNSFNLACSLSRQQCQVVLNRSAHVTIDPEKQYMSYRIEGTTAQQLSSAFFANGEGQVFYLATDRMFRIYGNAALFVFEAATHGLHD